MKILLFAPLLVLASISLSTSAVANSCSQYWAQQSNLLIEVESEPVGERGLLAWKGEPTPANKLAAFAKGVKFWGTKIFVVESKAEALELHQFLIEADALGATAITGIYIVSRPGNSGKLKSLYEKMHEAGEKKNSESEKLFSEIKEKDEIYQASREGELIPLTAKQKELFDPKEIQVLQARPDSPAHFYKQGWHDPAQRGAMVLGRSTFFPEGSGSAKKIRKTINRAIREGKELLEEGYQIVVGEPSYMEPVVLGAMNQRRTKGGVAQASTWITEADVANYKKLQEQGNAFNSVILDPSGKPVAGNFGMMKDGRIWIASVFYPEGNLNMAKVMGYALRIRLHQAGYRVIDQGMVSGYTKELGAKYIDRQEFHDLASKAQKADPLAKSNFKPKDFDYQWGE